MPEGLAREASELRHESAVTRECASETGINRQSKQNDPSMQSNGSSNTRRTSSFCIRQTCPTEEAGARNPDKQKLTGQGHLRPADLWVQIQPRMSKDGAKELWGLAPPGDMEKRIPQHLDAIPDSSDRSSFGKATS